MYGVPAMYDDVGTRVIHAHVVGRHVEQPRRRRKSRGLLVLPALEAGADVLHVPFDAPVSLVESTTGRPVFRSIACDQFIGTYGSARAARRSRDRCV